MSLQSISEEEKDALYLYGCNYAEERSFQYAVAERRLVRRLVHVEYRWERDYTAHGLKDILFETKKDGDLLAFSVSIFVFKAGKTRPDMKGTNQKQNTKKPANTL